MGAHRLFQSLSVQLNSPKPNLTVPRPRMPLRRDRVLAAPLAAAAVALLLSVAAGAGACELAVLRRNSLYSFNLASPTPKHPHGALSEDGFYKVAVNETLLWFQLCGQMLFNHDPPRCYDCQDCGGPSHCGTRCSALVANNLGGYQVCKTIGQASNLIIGLIDENNPQRGVNVKMSVSGHRNNCSLSVSVFCDSDKVQVPDSLDITGTCDFATRLRHPSGCAKISSANGNGFGWFGTLIIIVLCLLGGYLVSGAIYRFFFLGIRGAEAIPYLEFWLSLPQRARDMFGSVLRRFHGQSGEGRGSYAPMNY